VLEPPSENTQPQGAPFPMVEHPRPRTDLQWWPSELRLSKQQAESQQDDMSHLEKDMLYQRLSKVIIIIIIITIIIIMINLFQGSYHCRIIDTGAISQCFFFGSET